MNAGESEDLRFHAELTRDIQELVLAIERDRGRRLTADDRRVVEETYRAAIAGAAAARIRWQGVRVIWTMRIQGQDGLVLRVTDAFLHELLPRVRDPIVKQLDPYRDSILDQSALVRWCHELSRVKQDIRSEIAHRLVEERGLPRDLALRVSLLREWVDRELRADEHFKTLIEVETMVNLVLEAGGVINVFGD